MRKNIIEKGLPKGVTLVSRYHHSHDEYVLCVNEIPVAYVYEKCKSTYESWLVHKYLTDEKQFVDDIMHKYREYLKDVWFATLYEKYKEVKIEESKKRNAANEAISRFKNKKGVW